MKNPEEVRDGADNSEYFSGRLLLLFPILLFTCLVSCGTASRVSAAEAITKVPCIEGGDWYYTVSNQWIPSERMIGFKQTGPGYRGVCSLKADPPGYRWVGCIRNRTSVNAYFSRRSDKSLYRLGNVISAESSRDGAPDGWVGSCLIRN